MGRSHAAIKRCCQEWVDSGKFQRHDLSSRPRSTADQEDRLIVRSTVTALDSSLSTIRRVTRTRVSPMTLHRRLTERNLRSYRPLRQLPLTPAHCRARLQWCLNRSGWNHAYWGRIVFSDESRFQLCSDDHRRRVWKWPGLLADRTFPIARHTGPQQEVMVWGAISFEAGPLLSSLEAHLRHIGTSTTF
ncbi:HTH_Tnp_Tc3_2 domain-containing protein [Trichonephila clavipes]|nr:HTH_Tnp_Tc3_2 domain-containing protein [Trichonephila clavipes]